MKKSMFVGLLFSVCLYANEINLNTNNQKPDSIKLTGTVVSDGQQMIGSRFMGYVKKVFVKIGDHVKREDDLYEMESAEFDMMKMQADLMLEQAKTMVEFWRDKLKRINTKKVLLRDRYKNDNKINFMDMADLDAEAANVETMLKAMQIMVKESNIKAKQLASTYNYIKMKAPSDGVVVRRNIRVGDMVMPGMLTILLVDMENLEIDVSLSESIISKVKVGQKVSVEIPSISYKTHGVIHAIVPDANPMTHKIKMRIRFERGKENIFPGMYAKVTI
ncbi:MAG: acriflavin resistance protein [Sulfurovum sp.]|nr:MAG: acriflavin resistance protein [Sulfurovum sp.]RUM71687.1 MAG: acriflavin resistance protein [Sulfurovum sp.]RUM76870.1 MAG: acriflavin resistance protein [Sulfurovum sp.]